MCESLGTTDNTNSNLKTPFLRKHANPLFLVSVVVAVTLVFIKKYNSFFPRFPLLVELHSSKQQDDCWFFWLLNDPKRCEQQHCTTTTATLATTNSTTPRPTTPTN
jgi:hypothetical protein